MFEFIFELIVPYMALYIFVACIAALLLLNVKDDPKRRKVRNNLLIIQVIGAILYAAIYMYQYNHVSTDAVLDTKEEAYINTVDREERDARNKSVEPIVIEPELLPEFTTKEEREKKTEELLNWKND